MKPIQLAGCAIFDDYGRILLLHRSGDDVSTWEMPGGKIEDNEVAEQAAVREVFEELNITVQLSSALGYGEFEKDDKEYRYTWFKADIQSGEPRINEPLLFDDLDYFEIEDLLSLSLSENMTVFLEKIFSGEVAL